MRQHEGGELKLYTGWQELNLEGSSRSVATIGNFDGLHLGHKAILAQLKQEAIRHNLNSVVVTFDPHPEQVLSKDIAFKRLFPVQDLIEQLELEQVDQVLVIPFTEQMAKVSAHQFLCDYLVDHLNPKSLIVGHDFHFGHKGEGSTETLKEHSVTYGYDFHIVPPFKLEEVRLSSSLLRELVTQGQLSLVKKYLGRNFYVKSKVVAGEGRGHSIGVPTANLEASQLLLPAVGVYLTHTHIAQQSFPGVTNVGYKPTFNTQIKKPVVETHILDWQGDLYEKDIRVEFVQKLRDEKKFRDPDALVQQIRTDIIQAKEILN